MITAEEARQIWRYEPETGLFFWLVAPLASRKIGDLAGYVDEEGYWKLYWKKRSYRAHRVAWLMQTGRWPTREIDHVNCDKLDNRFANLREASKPENCRNRPAPTHNQSGFKGVSKCVWPSGTIVFRAQIHKDPGFKRSVHLGYFQTAEEAAAAYRKAALKFHGDFART